MDTCRFYHTNIVLSSAWLRISSQRYEVLAANIDGLECRQHDNDDSRSFFVAGWFSFKYGFIQRWLM
jgi:hypothetical protein